MAERSFDFDESCVTEYFMDDDTQILFENSLHIYDDTSESCEVEMVDFSKEELEDIEKEFRDKEISMNKVPVEIVPRFVHEDEIPLVVHHGNNKDLKKNFKPAKKVLVCDSCGKRYQKEIYYAKHISVCDKKQPLPEKKSAASKEAKNEITAKKRKNDRGNAITTINGEVFAEKNNVFREALVRVRNDKNNNKKIGTLKTPGNKVAELSTKLLADIEDNALLENLSHQIFDLIGKIVVKTNFSNVSSKELMWRNVNKNAQISVAPNSFIDYFAENSTFSSATTSFFYHQFCMKYVYGVMRILNKNNRTIEKKVEVKLSEEEEQIIYYVSGYVVYALLKKYRGYLLRNPKNVTANDAIKFLLSLKANSEGNLSGNSFHDYVKKWSKNVDRGFLVKVNDDMYGFVKEVELAVCRVMHVDNLIAFHGQDLRDLLENELDDNFSVGKTWDVVSKNISSQALGKVLKRQIISKWIDIRAKSFVTTYVQILKNKYRAIKGKRSDRSISTAAEPSLRATLH